MILDKKIGNNNKIKNLPKRFRNVKIKILRKSH